MSKMKYRIITDNDESTIVIEDGGVATTHSTEEYITLSLYQSRITNDTDPDEVWDELGEGKLYQKDFPLDVPFETMLEEALTWLVFGTTMSDFEEDNSIWTTFFN